MFEAQHESQTENDAPEYASKPYTPAFNELPFQPTDTRALYTIPEEVTSQNPTKANNQVGPKKYYSIRQKLKNELRDITI